MSLLQNINLTHSTYYWYYEYTINVKRLEISEAFKLVGGIYTNVVRELKVKRKLQSYITLKSRESRHINL